MFFKFFTEKSEKDNVTHCFSRVKNIFQNSLRMV